MRLPIVLGVLAAVSTTVWVWPTHQERTTLAAAAPLFGKNAAPDTVTSLRIASWDEATNAPMTLGIAKANGVWTIPSHFDFPADGNTKVTEAAVSFLGVERGRIVTSDDKRHEELGVLDPLDEATVTRKGHGKRITMTDASGAQLVDLIVGKYVEGASGMYYVREAGSKDVYTAKVDPWKLSTQFVDYVETNPFKITATDVDALSIADYSVDETAGTVGIRAETSFARTAADQSWTPTGKTATPEGKRVAKTALDNLVNEVNGLKLVGVRPFDPAWLQARGFYVEKNGAIYGNEGSISVTTKNGLRYYMFFGEVALDDVSDKAADKAKKDAPGKDAKPDDKKPEEQKKGENRYLAVFVQYDAAADETAKTPAKDPKDAKSIAGKDLADKAQKRFTKFFYVISDDSFKKLRPSLETLFEAKPPEPMAGKTGKTNSDWLAENGKRPGVTTTPSGLQYEVVTSGPADGKLPTDADNVEVRYKGTLVDGEEFDSTKDDATATFPLRGLTKGWVEALKLMKPGDKWKLTVPPALGYGEAGSQPKIGPSAILLFDVELVKIK